MMISLAHAQTAGTGWDLASAMLQLLPMLIILLIFAAFTFSLAKKKGINAWKWTLLSLIPGINFFVLIYVAGLPDELLHKKIDQLLNVSSTSAKE